MGQFIGDQQWRRFDEQGYLVLDRVIDDAQLAAMQQRIDDIMLGKAAIDYDRTLMQLDAGTEDYGALPPQTKGHKGATLAYRKIEQLEFDPIFLGYMQLPLFAEVCAHVYGPRTRIACHRAMFMNKPASKGSILPWHQDAWTSFDRQPLLTTWLAMDPATIANGCVQLIPGSHRLGRVNPDHASGFLTEEQVRTHCPADQIIYLELKAGQVALLHNWTLHRSDVNRTDRPRRAFSVNYMDAATVDRTGRTYSIIFGAGALVPQSPGTARA